MRIRKFEDYSNTPVSSVDTIGIKIKCKNLRATRIGEDIVTRKPPQQMPQAIKEINASETNSKKTFQRGFACLLQNEFPCNRKLSYSGSNT
ncbi:hypothetical protein NPIL_367031 [Nephila pilipes]|uniref:Uncharacterized protein n=1 Tax=Nephila pilipes TaxID=299642 RepID=A0A8X6TG55_NEPPI|nr:hypothetical protein NPIL_615581 [Nephila pilipes]GFT05998.1 hypothetical protein NPIL_367031 [Nephila pilipes]